MFIIQTTDGKVETGEAIAKRLNAIVPDEQAIQREWEGDHTLWAFSVLTDDEQNLVASVEWKP